MSLKLYNSNQIICGCDEAGRGALAGPVVASAVILTKPFYQPELNDSKKISKKLRHELASFIKQNSLGWAIGLVSEKEIDRINILNASIKAMHIAIHRIIAKINQSPELLIIDGNRFKPYKSIEHKCIIKGDAKYASIAAASVLAKTYRDKLMNDLHVKHPMYNWKENKGYPTKEHKKKIIYHGINKYHRKSFKLLDPQYTLEL